jgi:long-chain acyl-CoA synthetase
MQFLLMTPGIDDADFSSLRAIVYGASPISRDVLVRAIDRFGCDFYQAYGLTETTGAVVMLPAADHDPDGPHPERLQAAGLAMPGVELRIADPVTSAPVPAGAVGELWIRSSQVMAGYWNQPHETAHAITPDGWFRSGDAGYLDDDGYFFISDRVKDMIISGGENIYPAEVEHVLMEHPDVADVAVIGVPDDRWGETVKALVVRTPGTTTTEADLIAFTRDRLAGYKCPTSVDWIDVLPRNPSGKVLKRDLREPYWRDHDRAVH